MGAKVADFGLSRFFSKTHTHITNTTIGTEDYMPPEFRFKNQISSKNNVYSLGIIIIEIMAGRRGYSEFRAMDDATPFLEQVITNWRERINATTSPFPLAELDQVETCIKIAIKCVDPERKNRPTGALVWYLQLGLLHRHRSGLLSAPNVIWSASSLMCRNLSPHLLISASCSSLCFLDYYIQYRAKSPAVLNG